MKPTLLPPLLEVVSEPEVPVEPEIEPCGKKVEVERFESKLAPALAPTKKPVQVKTGIGGGT